MTKVLFITEKWHDHNNQSNGLTNNMQNLIGSYECSGYGTYQHCPISPEDIWSSQGVDDALLSNTYDAAIISVYYHLPSAEVARQVGHKTAMCWWDSVRSMDGVRAWAPSIHQLCFDWGKGEECPNCFCIDVPQDTRFFHKNESIQEDIDISFIGSLTSYWSDRQAVIDKIKNAGINIWAGGGRGPGLGNLSVQEYADIFKRSKICLNLSYGHGQPQRKGRSFEIAACGQFMMTNCPQMFNGKDGNWFEDNVDFISFNDDDLIDKIKYYLENNQMRETIANNIYQKYLDNYAPKHFWKRILNICGVSV